MKRILRLCNFLCFWCFISLKSICDKKLVFLCCCLILLCCFVGWVDGRCKRFYLAFLFKRFHFIEVWVWTHFVVEYCSSHGCKIIIFLIPLSIVLQTLPFVEDHLATKNGKDKLSWCQSPAILEQKTLKDLCVLRESVILDSRFNSIEFWLCDHLHNLSSQTVFHVFSLKGNQKRTVNQRLKNNFWNFKGGRKAAKHPRKGYKHSKRLSLSTIHEFFVPKCDKSWFSTRRNHQIDPNVLPHLTIRHTRVKI